MILSRFGETAWTPPHTYKFWEERSTPQRHKWRLCVQCWSVRSGRGHRLRERLPTREAVPACFSAPHAHQGCRAQLLLQRWRLSALQCDLAMRQSSLTRHVVAAFKTAQCSLQCTSSKASTRSSSEIRFSANDAHYSRLGRLQALFQIKCSPSTSLPTSRPCPRRPVEKAEWLKASKARKTVTPGALPSASRDERHPSQACVFSC